MLIPIGFYINLDSRTDRKEHFEKQKTQFDFLNNISRFSAIKHDNGVIGCGKSHFEVLKKCLTIESDMFLICEDDFIIFNKSHFNDFVNKIDINEEWDIITMTPRGDTVKNDVLPNGFKRIINNQTATAYIMKKHMIPILIQNLNEAIIGLESNKNPSTFAIDQYWKRLQTTYKFYYFEKLFGGQLSGYSNIEERLVDYNKRFLLQNNY